MNSSPGTVSNRSPANAVVRRLLIGWLPIISVGLLILWLSGGIFPTAWLLLIQMLSRWRVLYSLLGSGIYIPFFVVLAQCIMILGAWVLLAFTIRREISVVNTIRVQQRIVRLQATMAAPQALPDVVSAPSGVQVMSEEQDEELLAGLFDDDAALTPKNTGIKIVSTEQDGLFDASDAVFELSSETHESEVGATSAGLPQMKDEEETIFVYGNPFDGELPEVFEYDKDLKRGVQNMNEELRNQHQLSEERKADKADSDEKLGD